MRLRRKERWKQGLGACAGMLLLAAVPIGIFWHAVSLETLNQRLLSAVKVNDTDRVLALLARGADANTHDEPPRKLSPWQRLQEMLHLKQRPPSHAPSALRLAFEWRPGAGSALRPTIEETPLIKALMQHGARLEGPEIVAHMARTYAFCSSYQDTGTVSMTNASESLSFGTAFVRPDRLSFEYRRKGGDHYLFWENSDGLHSWWTVQPMVQKSSSLEMTIAGATGISLGAAFTVPTQLVPDQVPSVLPSYRYFEPHLTGIKTVDGVACYEIKLTGRLTTAIYVDTKWCLLRKMLDTYPGNNESVTLYHPQVNVPISEGTFQFHPPK